MERFAVGAAVTAIAAYVGLRIALIRTCTTECRRTAAGVMDCLLGVCERRAWRGIAGAAIFFATTVGVYLWLRRDVEPPAARPEPPTHE